MKLKKSKSIYVIENEKVGMVKIGVSDNLNSRLGALQHQCGMKLEMRYCTSPVYNYLEIESKAHDKFKEFRTFGEWFIMDKEPAIDYLKVVLRPHLQIDEVYKEWLEQQNISLLARQFGLSRAAIQKHLKKYEPATVHELNTQDLKEIIVDKPAPDKPKKKRVELTDVPARSKKIVPNIYEHEGKYFVKKWKHGKFVVVEKDSLEACQQFLKMLEE